VHHCTTRTKPLIPSIILNAFIIPTTQNIVNGIPNKPSSISQIPKRLPKFEI
jgi:hypothetical protein